MSSCRLETVIPPFPAIKRFPCPRPNEKSITCHRETKVFRRYSAQKPDKRKKQNTAPPSFLLCPLFRATPIHPPLFSPRAPTTYYLPTIIIVIHRETDLGKAALAAAADLAEKKGTTTRNK